jgi:RNA polymerase sigma-70 factor (ECF subfamily)
MTGRDRFAGQFDDVLARAQHGDGRAFEQIFTTLAPVVAGYLRLQGSREPDDLTSEVFVGVLRTIGSFRGGEAEFRSWLFTIAHRRLSDERRGLGRRPPPEPLDGVVERAGGDDVEADVTRALEDARIRELCAALRPDQRDVLLLRLLAGLTIDEIAGMLGKSPGAVKQIQRRGYAALAAHLEGERVPR